MSTSDFRSLQVTFVPRTDVPGQGRLHFWCMPPRRVDHARRSMVQLGVVRKNKSPALGKVELVIPTPTRNKKEDWEIAELQAVRLPLVEAVRGLVRLDLGGVQQRRVSDSLRVWSLAAKLAVELVASEQIVPLLDRGGREQKTVARWAVTNLTPQTRERIAQLEEAMPIAGHCVVDEEGKPPRDGRPKRRKSRRRRRRKPVTPTTTIHSPRDLLRTFLDAVADAMSRDALPSTARDRPRKDNRELAPWELRWRYSLTASDPCFESAGLVERRLVDEIARWASPVRPKAVTGTAYSVAYQLEQPGASPETEGVPDAWFLRYLLQANDEGGVFIDAQQVWDCGRDRIEVDGRTFVEPHETLLESLAEMSRLFPPVGRSLEVARPAGVLLTTEEAWEFISSVGPELQQFGIGIRVPRELRADGHQRLRLKLRVGGDVDWEGMGDDKPSRVGIGELAAFRWQVALGDIDLSPEDFREVAALKKPLVQWRGQWLAVDPSKLKEMEKLFDGASTVGTMDRSTALAAALSGSFVGDERYGAIEVVGEGEIGTLIDGLRSAEVEDALDSPEGFVGELRPYQLRGLTWLSNLSDLGFGACLADDMGLGKTIQVIALLLSQIERSIWDGESPALLVCPTSVLGNWERELRRFGPELHVVRHHGRARASSIEELKKACKGPTVVLTTYVLARIDAEVLGTQRWSHLVIDEAQNIKNPSSQQARAIRSIGAERRIALTGTPVENRLTELWSILEFANPGLLGSLGDFRRRFALPIERLGDRRAADTLRRMVSPFILRRSKTDPNVIQDLPDKLEQKVYCTLTREQASLYQAAVDATLDRITATTGVKRKANILALLTSLKQICNHPAHYLKEDERLFGRSGKLTRLLEMLEEVFAEGDSCLIFTQYKAMGDLLAQAIEERLDTEVPFIHGGVPAAGRDRIVADFQEDEESPPVLLLSLKAGGTGLNLTRANHVFHFDRWWNPAVEDQATDRAYRVGQTRHVQVHKFMVGGTIEEKIDDILESKRNLADSVVGEGESWLTELGDEELRDLFTLGQSIEIEEEEAAE